MSLRNHEGVCFRCAEIAKLKKDLSALHDADGNQETANESLERLPGGNKNEP